MPAAARPLPIDAKRALRPNRSPTAAWPTSPRLIAAIAGLSTQLRGGVQNLRAEHGGKDRPQREHQRACADAQHRKGGDAPLRPHGVEDEPARHLKGQRGQASGGQNQSDVDLRPLMGREVDGDEGTEPGLYVGDEEREPVERALAPARRAGRRLRRRPVCRPGPRIVGFAPAAFDLRRLGSRGSRGAGPIDRATSPALQLRSTASFAPGLRGQARPTARHACIPAPPSPDCG